MSEFVCEVAPDEFGELTEVTNLGEEIVRCRDCKFMAGKNKAGITENYCFLFDFIAEPDGFCAWGNKR